MPSRAVHAATGELLDGARTFLGQVAEEHRERAEELRATLASHRDGCRQKVAEMRHGHQEALQTMRDELHQTLSEARRMRQDATSRMFQTFRHARHELAADLRVRRRHLAGLRRKPMSAGTGPTHARAASRPGGPPSTSIDHRDMPEPIAPDSTPASDPTPSDKEARRP